MGNKRLNATITIGGSVSGTLNGAITAAKGKLGQVGDAVRRLEREQAALNKQIHTFAGYGGKDLQGLIDKQAAVTRELEKQRKILAKGGGGGFKTTIREATEAIHYARSTIGVIGEIGSMLAVPVKKAVALETAMLGVAKQVQGARNGSGELTSVYFDMQRQIQALARVTPMATEKIAEMVAAGARMDIPKHELIEFAHLAANMADAFELPAEELAEQMGKIKGLFGLAQGEVRGLADAINYLDDNAISKGGDIIEFMQRTGGVAASVKISAQQMAALGSTLLTLGEKTQTAGTAVNAMVQKFAAADKGTKKFKAAMKEVGLSTSAVQKGMQVDAQATMLKVMDAVNRMPKEKRLGIMVDLVGLEHSDTLAKLASNVATYKQQIDMATSKLAIGSVAREADARLKSTNAQLEIFNNRINEIAVNLGAVALPTLNKALKLVGGAISDITDASGGDKDAKRRLIGAAKDTARGLLGIKSREHVPENTAPEVLAAPAPMPKFRFSGANIENKTDVQINVTQQPGQSGKDFAKQVAEEVARQQAIARRSSMIDSAGAQ